MIQQISPWTFYDNKLKTNNTKSQSLQKQYPDYNKNQKVISSARGSHQQLLWHLKVKRYEDLNRLVVMQIIKQKLEQEFNGKGLGQGQCQRQNKKYTLKSIKGQKDKQYIQTQSEQLLSFPRLKKYNFSTRLQKNLNKQQLQQIGSFDDRKMQKKDDFWKNKKQSQKRKLSVLLIYNKN